MDPFRIPQPAIVSFSGGRTSGYMLRRVIDAYGGSLPPEVEVVFCNTGREHPATYEFIEAVSRNWGCPVRWVEWTPERPFVREVSPQSADREGKVFAGLIGKKRYLPNPITRFCTSEMKVLAVRRFSKHTLGWDAWTTAVGIRADEPRRVAKIKDHGDEVKVCPLARAGVTASEVNEFWKASDFDLGFPPGDNSAGNCFGCFLKSRKTLERLIAEDPERMKWWVGMEDLVGARFRKDIPTYKQMLQQVSIQGVLFDGPDTEGIACGACTD
jgi:3'-phosphoadenosine 5'-phosphosulfate sulfotransferase (PAPS reductase)/FAD synthetase